VVMGTAVQRASQDAKKQLLECAAKVLKQKANSLSLKDGQVWTESGQSLSFSKVIVDFFGSKAGEIIGKGLYKDKRSAKAVLGSTTTFWEVGWGGVEIEVDPDTGNVHLYNYVSACDAGKAINPEQCVGQDEGAVMFGIGHTLMEEMIYEEGQLLNGNMVDYRVPTFKDLPDHLHTILIENANGPGPFGSKGIGEGGLLPVASAIANAVYRAVGVRIQELLAFCFSVIRACFSPKKLDSGCHRNDGLGKSPLALRFQTSRTAPHFLHVARLASALSAAVALLTASPGSSKRTSVE